MGQEPIVTLREYLEELIAQERSLRQQADMDGSTALVLQRTETDRRLDILNGAHELAVQVQATYVPREVYDNRIKSDDIAREAAAGEARLTAAALATKVEEAKLVAATAVAEAKAAAALALTTALTSLNARLEPLERLRYETAGRSGLSQPLMMMIAGLGGGMLVYFFERFATATPVLK